MNEDQIRAIIKDELGVMMKSDRFTFNRTIQIADGRNIIFGKGTVSSIAGDGGTKIGTEITQKLAFYGSTPIVQPVTVADPAGGATQDAEARLAVGAVIDRLQSLGLIA